MTPQYFQRENREYGQSGSEYNYRKALLINNACAKNGVAPNVNLWHYVLD